jgi:hypothetical protein
MEKKVLRNRRNRIDVAKKIDEQNSVAGEAETKTTTTTTAVP